jgi:phage head maturation protease
MDTPAIHLDWRKRYGGDLALVGDGAGIASQRTAEILKIDSLDNGAKDVITYAITTEDIDRANDKVSVAGGRLENYQRNPVILWAHDHIIPAIGNGANLRAEPPKLLADAVFHSLTPFAGDVAKLAKAGVIRTVSIGFIPICWTDEQKTDNTPYPTWGWRESVRTYTDWELLEFSLCNVPMNPYALQNSAGRRQATEFGHDLRRALDTGIIAADGEYMRRFRESLPTDIYRDSAKIVADALMQQYIVRDIMNPTTKEETHPAPEALVEDVVAEICDRVETVVSDAVASVFAEYPGAIPDPEALASAIGAAAADAVLNELAPPEAPPEETAAAPEKTLKYALALIGKAGRKISKKHLEMLKESETFQQKSLRHTRALIKAGKDGLITEDEAEAAAEGAAAQTPKKWRIAQLG